MDRESTGAWPSGEATAFEAVDGGSIPSAPANGVGSSMEEHRLVKPGDVGSNPIPRPITRRSAPRGFFGVGLHNPKAEINAGAALRACGIYGASFMAIAGSRFARCRTDTMKAYRHLPVHNVEDLHDAIPFDCVPVAVELVSSARSLVGYTHPERAFYVFGPEDSSLGAKTLSWCRDVIYIPTDGCMNLAACVNVVLYDRMAKRIRL